MRKVLAIIAMLLAACSAQTSPQSELGAVVETALMHPSIVKYLHPEAPGRIPVTVAFRNPSGVSSLDAELFDQPIHVVSVSNNTSAIILSTTIKDNQAVIDIDYPTEGIVGEIFLQRNGTKWAVISSQLEEQRPNNSFKPTPLRGAA